MSKGLSQIDQGIYASPPPSPVIVIDPTPTPPSPITAPIASGTFNPPVGIVGDGYSYDTAPLFTGDAVVSYALIGTLPNGLSFNTSTGAITGTPTVDGVSGSLSVTGTNTGGSDTTNTDTLTINAAAGPPTVGVLWDADFENGTIGQLANGSDAFSGAKAYSFYSAGPPGGPHSGSQCAQMSCLPRESNYPNAGPPFTTSSNFNDHGGSKSLGVDLVQGQEFWHRVWWWWPTDWELTRDCKALRHRRETGAGGNHGYLDWFWRIGRMEIYTEFAGSNPYAGSTCHIRDFDTQALRGQWNAWESYVFLHSDRLQAKRKAWVNGTKIFDSNNMNECAYPFTVGFSETPFTDNEFLINTLPASDSKVTSSLVRTTWNDNGPDDLGPTKFNTEYVDDIIWTTDTPNQTDAFGDPFIGI